MPPSPDTAVASQDPETSLQPLVSVVTIFLNAERFLDEAVRSIMAQTYPNWELLLVDDGSTDGSSAAARRWAVSHADRVRYLEHDGHENRGMSASRNLGVRHARGTIVAFLDSDDVYLPEKLERQVALLEAYPGVVMVYGATQYWYGWTGVPADAARDRVRRQGVPSGTVVEPASLLAALIRNQAQTPCTCGVLVRRDAFDAVGGFEERFRGMFEDQAFFFKVFARVRVLVDSGCYDRYRQHPDSHCHVEDATGAWDATGAPSTARARFLYWLADYLGEAKLDADPALRDAIRWILGPYRSRVVRLAQRTAHSARVIVRSIARRFTGTAP